MRDDRGPTGPAADFASNRQRPTETDEELDDPPVRDDALAVLLTPLPVRWTLTEVRWPVAVARPRPVEKLRDTLCVPLPADDSADRPSDRVDWNDRSKEPKIDLDETLRDVLRSPACAGRQSVAVRPSAVMEARIFMGRSFLGAPPARVTPQQSMWRQA